MKKSCILSAVCTLLFISSSANSALLRWNLVDVGFTDGGTASGWFAYDTNTNSVTNWFLSTSGGGASFPNHIYDTTNSSNFNLASNTLMLFTADGSTRELRFLDNAGAFENVGAIDITVSDSFGNAECFNCNPRRDITTGQLISTSYGAPSNDVIEWNLVDVGFADDGTASGWLQYNTATNTVVDWFLSTSGGGASFPNHIYDTTNSSNFNLASNTLMLFTADGSTRELRFLDNAGAFENVGAIDITVSDSFGNAECFNCNPRRDITTGQLISTPTVVPVPATVWLFGSGLLGLVGVARRKST